MDGAFKYRAFISYSHADEQWARWLHTSLETYRVPRRLVGAETAIGPVPERLAPVFRDREELATATNLGDTLNRALQQSAFQVVICSMAAARSHWVNEEILAYKRLGREHRIFCLIADGEPGASVMPGREDEECFPPALRFRMGEDGRLTDEPSEPIAADLRAGKDSPQAAQSLNHLGEVLTLDAKYDQAEKVLREAQAAASQARDILAGVLPPDHWMVAAAENAEGGALTGLHRYAEAERLLLASLPGLASSPIRELAGRGRQRVAELYRAWDKPTLAARYTN